MPAKRKSPSKDSQPGLDSLVRHSSASSNQQTPTPSLSTASSPIKSSKKQLRHYHMNARRTKIHLILDHKTEGNTPQKRKRRVSLFLMSEQYKRKMSDYVQMPEEEPQNRRKISWGEDSEFVLFNKNKSCQAIRIAPRHKFSIDE